MKPEPMTDEQKDRLLRYLRDDLAAEERSKSQVIVGGDVSLNERLESIEKRMGRLEQLINVVLEKQEKRSVNVERAIKFALERMEGHIDRNFEDIENVLIAEMQRQSETEYTDDK
jgi:hypothetical protein